MKYKWTIKTLSDIADFNPRESLSKGTLAKKIAMDKLQPFCRDVPSFELEKFSGGTKFRNGDTIMARITPCLENGKTAKVNILDDGEIGFGSTEYIVFRAKKGTDKNYLYYLVCSPLVREPAIKSMVGSSGRQRVQTDVVQGLSIAVPSIEEQRQIGGILRALDDKIELNNEINKNLEEQAQSIFANEFLSLDTLPEGWKQASLIDIADYLNGLAMQKYRPTADESGIPVLKIKELRQGCCDDNSELCSPSIKSDYIIHDGDVIFSWSGSLLVDFWCGGTCGLNQHLFKVTSNIYDKWFYYSWTNYYLQKFAAIAADMATTMGHIKREELAKSRVLIPSNSDYERIGGLLAPLYNLVISNRIENSKLATIRDTLLPKLMSGEVDVSNLDL
ncbi:MAG: restriction endonuclease subunit S [Lactobacillus iners]|jgi:type I restriction-modification system, S subunit|nr:restriction endonuclease subunit S [Lactobacillus iners]MCT7775295.1 restriction endonuclease subunit S [Lactobacillus iners]